MKTLTLLAMTLLFAVACSHLEPTPRLQEANAAYQKATQGPAAQYSPAELATAKKALDQANASLESGDPAVVDDRAGIALDKIYAAESIGRAQQANAERDSALSELHITREQLLAQTQEQLDRERQGRTEAEAQLAESRRQLEQWAQVRDMARGTVITLSGGVLFDSGKADLLPGAQDRLARVADFLKNSPRGVTIEGYTDSRGSEANNLALSQRRAQAVRDFLATHGVPLERIKAEGKGESSPVASNATSAGRAQNRRVEIVLERGAATATPGTTESGTGMGGAAGSGTSPAPSGTPPAPSMPKSEPGTPPSTPEAPSPGTPEQRR